MAELITDLDAGVIRGNLERVRAEVGDAVEILAAIKYVATDELPTLAEAGVTLVGENRAQALEEKHEAHGAAFAEWDFIGHLQSRKVKDIVPLARLIHSVGSASALTQLEKHATPETRILLEVNVAEEEGKSGLSPADLPATLEDAAAKGLTVTGLMTMPPLASDPEDNRRWFAALAQLAATHDLSELSMGTSQDYRVAAEEGATIVRIGSTLYR